jgi:hypothetical protein
LGGGKPTVTDAILGRLIGGSHRIESKGDPSLSRRRRQLSSFSYNAVGQAINSRALLDAVPVAEVHPAFTSLISRIMYAKRLDASVYQAAALAISRRSMGYSETCPDLGFIPGGNGDHLIVWFPVRKRSAHAWSHWGKVSNAVQVTLAKWHRMRKLAALEASQTAQAIQGAP